MHLPLLGRLEISLISGIFISKISIAYIDWSGSLMSFLNILLALAPIILILVLLVLIAGGLWALFSIARQEDPTITNVFATITTVYPGAPPTRVEALVTAVIEELSLIHISEPTRRH